MTLDRPTLRTLLDDALPGAARASIPGEGEHVTRVTADSRRAVPGAVFVVLRGTRDDGAHFAADAVARGAALVIAGEDAELPQLAVPVVRVADPRGALALLARSFHGDPSRDLVVVGVTGTNGKTTTVHLVRAVLESADRGPCAVVGTIAYTWPGVRREAPNTTPGAEDLHQILGEARDAGCRSAAIEVSSHALSQRRTEGMRFAGAVFTNLTGDHLDYHGSMEAYADAKARLLRAVDAGGVIAVNAEDPYAATMVRDARARVLRYAIDATAHADVTARSVELTADGVRFTLVTPAGEAPVRSALLGRYNVLNLLGAAAVCHGLGVSTDDIARGLSGVGGIRGRLEPVDAGQPFTVLVDYAHTDDAVSNVLRNLRSVVRGRLIAVVGCGGDRDRTKRPRMARAAAELADLAWFTSDNPRTEDPLHILDDMLGGVYGARNVRVEADRRRAIARAVATAQVGDCIAILGKGHEDYQVLGTSKVPFDDREVAASAIASVLRGDLAAQGTR